MAGRYLRAEPAQRSLQPDQLRTQGPRRLRPRLRRVYRASSSVTPSLCRSTPFRASLINGPSSTPSPRLRARTTNATRKQCSRCSSSTPTIRSARWRRSDSHPQLALARPERVLRAPVRQSRHVPARADTLCSAIQCRHGPRGRWRYVEDHTARAERGTPPATKTNRHRARRTQR